MRQSVMGDPVAGIGGRPLYPMRNPTIKGSVMRNARVDAVIQRLPFDGMTGAFFEREE